MVKRFKGVNILVTGGSKGIGMAIVKRFAQEGGNVFFTYNTGSAGAKILVKDFAPGCLKPYQLDVSDFNRTESVVKKIVKDCRRIDVLVNNAGILKDMPIAEMQYRDFMDVVQTNLSGIFSVSKSVIPHMPKGRGRIVNISSVSALKGVMFQTNYSAAKSGMLGFTRSLAKELAKSNITVNAVCPGFIKTDMFDKLHPFVKVNAVKAIPLGRIGTPEEVAGLVGYLSSEEASYITGQVFVIDGGLTI